MKSYFIVYAYNFSSRGETLVDAILNYHNDAVREGHSPSYEGVVIHVVDGVEVGQRDLKKYQNI